jgi:hypothetical protein
MHNLVNISQSQKSKKLMKLNYGLYDVTLSFFGCTAGLKLLQLNLAHSHQSSLASNCQHGAGFI